MDPNTPVWLENRRIAAEIGAPVPDTAEFVNRIYTPADGMTAPEVAGVMWIVQGAVADEGRIETWIRPDMTLTETDVASAEGMFSAIMVNRTRFRASYIVRRDTHMDNRAARAKMDAIRARPSNHGKNS